MSWRPRTQSWSAVTYTASHDLKSPLVTIRGFLGFLERDARTGNLARFEADLGRIRAATDKMTTLLDELLQLSRVGRVVNPPEPVSLGHLAGRKVDLRLRHPPALGRGRGKRRARW